jgi:hypothetical protein
MIFFYKLSSNGSGGEFKRIGKYFKVSEGNARQCFEHVSMEILSLHNKLFAGHQGKRRKVYLIVFYELWLPSCDEGRRVECGIDSFYGADLSIEGESRR